MNRVELVRWYERNRARSRAIFDLVSETAYYTRPITLRHPIVFYEGHLPAFSFNTLVKRAAGEAGIDGRLEALFARGIDPDTLQSAHQSPSDVSTAWPSRAVVREFADEADRRVLAVLKSGDINVPGHPLLDRSEAVYTILEHEAMHQETLLYMWHRLPFHEKQPPVGYVCPSADAGTAPEQAWVEVPAGRATLGVNAGDRGFAWDNERPALAVDVPKFSIEQHNVTNAAFKEFVDAGGYTTERWWRPDDWLWVRRERLCHPVFWEEHAGTWYWRGMFELLPLPPAWPVFVSHAEASAFAAWRGVRLPSEPEYQRAAYGTPAGDERAYPWGDQSPTADRGVFDFASWDPAPVGSHPAGRSAWGVDDLVGNGWEWTRSAFLPFPGFRASPSYPEYSADFFDGEHMVMKGASPATAREFLRPTFRNWFRPQYPYVYATFRCARDGE